MNRTQPLLSGISHSLPCVGVAVKELLCSPDECRGCCLAAQFKAGPATQNTWKMPALGSTDIAGDSAASPVQLRYDWEPFF